MNKNRDQDKKAFSTSLVLLISLASLIVGMVLAYFIYPNILEKDISKARVGDKVAILYATRLTNGTQLESSQNSEKPFEFVLGKGMVFKGWDESILGMSVGEKKITTIPPEKAYGHGGVPDGNGGYVVPPDAPIVLEVELLGIRR